MAPSAAAQAPRYGAQYGGASSVALEAELAVLRRELRRTSDSYGTLAKEARALRVASQARERELEAEVTRLKTQLSLAERGRREHQESGAAVRTLREELAASQSAVATLRDRLEARTRERDSDAGAVSALEKQMAALRVDVERARHEASENRKAAERSRSLESDLAAARAQLSAAAEEKRQNEQAVREAASLRQALVEAEGRASAAAAASAALGRAKAAVGSHRQQAEEQQRRIAELTAQVEELRRQAEAHADRALAAQELEAVQAELLKAVAATGAELQHAQRQNKVLSDKAAALEEQRQGDERRLQRLEAVLDRYRKLESEVARRAGESLWGLSGLAYDLGMDLAATAEKDLHHAGPHSPAAGVADGSSGSAKEAPGGPLAAFLAKFERTLEVEATRRCDAERQKWAEQLEQAKADAATAASASAQQQQRLQSDLDQALRFRRAAEAAERELAQALEALKKHVQELSGAGAVPADAEGLPAVPASAFPAPAGISNPPLVPLLLRLGVFPANLSSALPTVAAALNALRSEAIAAGKRASLAEHALLDAREELALVRAGGFAAEKDAKQTAVDQAAVAVAASKTARETMEGELRAVRTDFAALAAQLEEVAARADRYKRKAVKARERAAAFEEAQGDMQARMAAADALVNRLQSDLQDALRRAEEMRAARDGAHLLLFERERAVDDLHARLAAVTASGASRPSSPPPPPRQHVLTQQFDPLVHTAVSYSGGRPALTHTRSATATAPVATSSSTATSPRLAKQRPSPLAAPRAGLVTAAVSNPSPATARMSARLTTAAAPVATATPFTLRSPLSATLRPGTQKRPSASPASGTAPLASKVTIPQPFSFTQRSATATQAPVSAATGLGQSVSKPVLAANRSADYAAASSATATTITAAMAPDPRMESRQRERGTSALADVDRHRHRHRDRHRRHHRSDSEYSDRRSHRRSHSYSATSDTESSYTESTHSDTRRRQRRGGGRSGDSRRRSHSHSYGRRGRESRRSDRDRRSFEESRMRSGSSVDEEHERRQTLRSERPAPDTEFSTRRLRQRAFEDEPIAPVLPSQGQDRSPYPGDARTAASRSPVDPDKLWSPSFSPPVSSFRGHAAAATVADAAPATSSSVPSRFHRAVGSPARFPDLESDLTDDSETAPEPATASAAAPNAVRPPAPGPAPGSDSELTSPPASRSTLFLSPTPSLRSLANTLRANSAQSPDQGRGQLAASSASLSSDVPSPSASAPRQSALHWHAGKGVLSPGLRAARILELPSSPPSAATTPSSIGGPSGSPPVPSPSEPVWKSPVETPRDSVLTGSARNSRMSRESRESPRQAVARAGGDAQGRTAAGSMGSPSLLPPSPPEGTAEQPRSAAAPQAAQVVKQSIRNVRRGSGTRI
jgi:hypothetical protein